MLGPPLAVALAVLNAMWYELMEGVAIRHDNMARRARGGLSRRLSHFQPWTGNVFNGMRR